MPQAPELWPTFNAASALRVRPIRAVAAGGMFVTSKEGD